MVKPINECLPADEELRRSEDRLRLIVNTIPAMAWTVRSDGVVDFVNQRWLDYAGLSLEEELEQPTRVIHPADVSEVMEHWLADMAAGRPFECEMRLRRGAAARRARKHRQVVWNEYRNRGPQAGGR
jgi:PAS domain S-box-containing protein